MNSPSSQIDHTDRNERADQNMKMIEMGWDCFKWMEAQTTDAMKIAARTLWLSNAGGLALVVALSSKVETVALYSAVSLVLSASSFIVGIYLGMFPHVHMAHKAARLQANIGKMMIEVGLNKKTPAEAMAKIAALVPDLEKKQSLVTENLIWARQSLGVGALFGVIGLALIFFTPLDVCVWDGLSPMIELPPLQKPSPPAPSFP
jgi:hypothetical protein